ncbi:MAG: hypothetical protein ACT6SC_04415, partial [Blastomonas fulva]
MVAEDSCRALFQGYVGVKMVLTGEMMAPVVRKAKAPVRVRPAAKPELPLGQILRGDCIEEMRKLPTGSIDMIFADPPYNL